MYLKPTCMYNSTIHLQVATIITYNHQLHCVTGLSLYYVAIPVLLHACILRCKVVGTCLKLYMTDVAQSIRCGYVARYVHIDPYRKLCDELQKEYALVGSIP